MIRSSRIRSGSAAGSRIPVPATVTNWPSARTVKRDGSDRRTLSTLDVFAGALTEFRVPLEDIGTGELAALWDSTEVRHEAWLAIQADAARR